MKNNSSRMIADYEFWVKFDKWDVEQMTALLLGYSPFYFDKRYVERLRFGLENISMSKMDVEVLLEEYDKMLALIINSIKSGSLKYESKPTQCYKWAVMKKIPVLENFKKAVTQSDSSIAQIGADLDNSGKRRKQLYKIILSMAIKYKFNPENLKNPSTAQFRNAIERAGLSIDDNTIRDVVTRSYEHFKDHLDHSIFEN